MEYVEESRERSHTSVDSLFKIMMKHIKTDNSSWLYCCYVICLKVIMRSFHIKTANVSVEVICNILKVYLTVDGCVCICIYEHLYSTLKNLSKGLRCYVRNAWNCNHRNR